MNWTAHEDIEKGTWVKKVQGLRCMCFGKAQVGDTILALANDDFAQGEAAQLMEVEGTNSKEFVKAAPTTHYVKRIEIVVNGRLESVPDGELSRDEIIKLAFGKLPSNAILTVQYARGGEANPSGVLLEGQSVKVKSGMVFDAVSTSLA